MSAALAALLYQGVTLSGEQYQNYWPQGLSPQPWYCRWEESSVLNTGVCRSHPKLNLVHTTEEQVWGKMFFRRVAHIHTVSWAEVGMLSSVNIKTVKRFHFVDLLVSPHDLTGTAKAAINWVHVARPACAPGQPRSQMWPVSYSLLTQDPTLSLQLWPGRLSFLNILHPLPLWKASSFLHPSLPMEDSLIILYPPSSHGRPPEQPAPSFPYKDPSPHPKAPWASCIPSPH